MKKATNKILSFLTAFAMVIGVLVAPFASANASKATATPIGATADEETKTVVTVHKMKLNTLEGFPRGQEKDSTKVVGLDKETEYTGNEIDNISGFFGTGAEELAGVTFTYWIFDDAKAYETLMNAPDEYRTVEKVKEVLKTEGTDIVSTDKGVKLPEITVPANKHKFVWAIEKSSVIQGEEGKSQTITGAAAVPFGLALPFFNADGSVIEDLHVYPKNTTASEPKVDKDFKGHATAGEDRKEIEENITESRRVGEEVEYDIETLIPAGSNYQTAKWTDQMTEGLTFEQSHMDNLKVYIGPKDSQVELESSDYTVALDGNGFILQLTGPGLEKVNGNDSETRIYITYSATLNGLAKVQRQERNDVIFHYGNKQDHSNTPKPQKPSNGKLKVTKNFPEVEGGWAEGETVEVTIYDAHTGKVATLPNNQSPKVTLSKDKQSHIWTGLDDTKQYKVKETFKPGNEAEYDIGEAGQIIIRNYKNDIPGPKDPQEPGVVTYGHRFQKVDQTDKTGLPNAIFVVRDSNGEGANYLKEKTNAEKEYDQVEYAKAEKAYKDAVKAATTDNPNTDEIARLKEARDAAYVKVNTQWDFTGTSADDAFKFESNEDGYFKVVGLAEGTYYLEETKAPDGYASLNSLVEFSVDKDSNGDTTSIKPGELEVENGFKQIDNKKVTIPQTGGIGSLIFIVAGLAIMGVAFVAMRRRNSVEA